MDPHRSFSNTPQWANNMSFAGSANFSEATEYGDTGTTSAWWSDVRLEPPWSPAEVVKLEERYTQWTRWRLSLLSSFQSALVELKFHFNNETRQRGLVGILDQGYPTAFYEYSRTIGMLENESQNPVGGLVVTVNRARTLIGLQALNIDAAGHTLLKTVLDCALDIARRYSIRNITPAVGIPPQQITSHHHPYRAVPRNTPGSSTTIQGVPYQRPSYLHNQTFYTR